MTDSKLLVKDKSIVAPGESLAEGMEYLPGTGTYRLEDKILANQVGVLHVEGKVLKTTPLVGRYLPKRNDVIIGKVIDILMSGWRIDINSPYAAVLPLKEATREFIDKGADLTEYFDLDDYVVCKITQVTSQNLIDVSMKVPGTRKLIGGRFITVNPAKVPRIIGRKGSMVSMLKHATECHVVVGQNGLIWISGDPKQEIIAVEVVRKIDLEAHVPGLTERVKKFLEKKTGKAIDLEAIQQQAEQESRQMQQRSYDRSPPRRPPRQRRYNRPRQESFKKR